MSAAQDLLFVTLFARLLEERSHPLIGTNAPAPSAAALLARALSGDRMRVTVIGSPKHSRLTDDLAEVFDCAARGMFDAFFIGGGQIDGMANVNLVGVGNYPDLKRRWPGSHGTPLLYMMIPNAILYVRSEHNRRTLVPKVDFISTPGTSEPGTYRPGGPIAMITSRCVFRFHRNSGGFELVSVHPGHTLQEIDEHTGFIYRTANDVTETPGPTRQMLRVLRDRVCPELASLFPQFCAGLAAEANRLLESGSPVADAAA